MNENLGYVKWEHGHWKDKDDNKLYFGTFRETYHLCYWREITIKIWTKHIKKTLKDICQRYNSIKEIEKLADKIYKI